MPLTGPLSIDTAPTPLGAKRGLRLSLFWRTFLSLALLLLASAGAWLQTYRAFESEPRAAESAKELASLINLSRFALRYSDDASRQLLIKTLADDERVYVTGRKTADKFEPFQRDLLSKLVNEEVKLRLGPDSLVAAAVNEKKGLWVGFSVDNASYWLRADESRFSSSRDRAWLFWLLIAAALSLVGAAVMARFINRPIKQLSFAASRVRDGDFAASLLDEQAATSEVREANIGFNRMAEQLSKVEQDRVVMLAGISHDLRTPLARLRLETELSVADKDARAHMAADISQLDAIIDKFLDYARPEPAELATVSLNAVVEAAMYGLADATDIRITLDLPDEAYVLADETELLRVVTNLLENARRYGKTPETGIALVDIAAKVRDQWVLIKLRDHGMGVADDTLPKLTRPFFRGDAARTAATGAGLGLAIVEKTLQRMGGAFALANTASGGLAAHIKLRRAD